MSEENKPQVIIHKSNWAKQLIIVVVVLVIFFFAISKNPSKTEFIQGCVREYVKKEKSVDPSTANYISEITTEIFGSWIEPLIERNDFVLFSKFNVDIDNDQFKMKITAYGFFGYIFFTEGVMVKKKEKFREDTSEDSSGDLGCGGLTYSNDFEGFSQWVDDNDYYDPEIVDGDAIYVDNNGYTQMAFYNEELQTFE
jgi:hypothetical protein